jgi:4-hydroxy-tetrahydrodipicolinate reductase
MKIGITGISGRMGGLLAREIIVGSNKILQINGALAGDDRKGIGDDVGLFLGLKKTNVIITDDLEKLYEDCDGVIDFSTPVLGIKCAELTSKYGKKLVTGTTGYDDEQLELIKDFSKNCVIVQSNNMSIGINLLLNVIEEVALQLGVEYDAEVLEMHHRNKKDSPSGTALMLGKAIAKGRGLDFDAVAKKSRDGIIGIRSENEIGFATLRGGSVVGEHSVLFAGTDEVIKISHSAGSRQIFVNGAIRAMTWTQGQKNGLYSMRDIFKK